MTTRPYARRAAAATATITPRLKPTQGFGCLWSRLKTEVLEVCERPLFADLADAQGSVADHFDYYNHGRLHFSIDY